MRALFGVLLFILFTVEPEGFFRGYWHTVMSSAAPLFKGNPINLWDLAIILLGLAVAARPSTWRQRARPLDQALLALMSILFAAMVWGALRGGQVRMAYYQLAGLLRMVLLMHVVLGLFRTPRDFVVHVLQKFFRKNEAEATQLMLQVHYKGMGIAGVFTHEVAETKAYQVHEYAKENKYPLRCSVEKA